MSKSAEQIEAYIEELGMQGVDRSKAVPPLYRLLWKLGVPVNPPLSQSFLSVAMVHGFYFGPLWALGMWFFMLRDGPNAFAVTLFAMLLAGTLFGAIAGFKYRKIGRDRKVPEW